MIRRGDCFGGCTLLVLIGGKLPMPLPGEESCIGVAGLHAADVLRGVVIEIGDAVEPVAPEPIEPIAHVDQRGAFGGVGRPCGLLRGA